MEEKSNPSKEDVGSVQSKDNEDLPSEITMTFTITSNPTSKSKSSSHKSKSNDSLPSQFTDLRNPTTSNSDSGIKDMRSHIKSYKSEDMYSSNEPNKSSDFSTIDENIDKHAQMEKAKVKKAVKIWFYLVCYLFIFLYLGAFYCIPSALFNSLQKQLGISTKQMATLWSAYDLSYGVSSVISGFVIDAFSKTHLYVTFFVIISFICLCLMNETRQYHWMLLIWIILALSQGVFDCSVAVYVYRIYNVYSNMQRGTIVLSLLSVLALVMMTLFLPLITLSLSIFGSYAYAMYFLGIFVLPILILMSILSTPGVKKDEEYDPNDDFGSPKLLAAMHNPSINFGGLMAISMNKTNFNHSVQDSNQEMTTFNISNMFFGSMAGTRTKAINTPITTPIATPVTSRKSHTNMDSELMQLDMSKRSTPRSSAIWFDVEDKLSRVSQSMTFLAADLEKIAAKKRSSFFQGKKDKHSLHVPKHDRILGLTPQNKFDTKMHTIRETRTMSGSLDVTQLDLPPLNKNRSTQIYDFNTLLQQKRDIQYFAVLNMALMSFYQAQNVLYGAYVSIYVTDYIKLSPSNALYFVTAFFSGYTLGRFLSLFIFNRLRADHFISILCSLMFVNGMLFLLVHIFVDVETDKSLLIACLYVIMATAGTLSSPLFNASFAFLTLIQPITGFVTSLLFAGFCIGGAVSAILKGALVDLYGASIIPYCGIFELFFCLAIALSIQIKFKMYCNKYGVEEDDDQKNETPEAI